MIRQAAGPNDHPMGPTFLHLYRILSLYSILKPPKTGNCSILDVHAPKITISELKEIFQSNESIRDIKLKDIRSKIDEIVEEGHWEADDIFIDHPYNDSSALNCIIYYASGYIAREIAKSTSCKVCIDALVSPNKYVDVPDAHLVNIKTKGALTHPNTHLFQLINIIEKSFAKHCAEYDVFDSIIEETLNKLSFPCVNHKGEIILKILTNYSVMRMRHFAVQQNREQKLSQKKKKLAKLMSI